MAIRESELVNIQVPVVDAIWDQLSEKDRERLMERMAVAAINEADAFLTEKKVVRPA